MVIFVDVPVPLSPIDGTGDVDNIDTEEDNNIVHETGITFCIHCLRFW
jgi:hypothetical protein